MGSRVGESRRGVGERGKREKKGGGGGDEKEVICGLFLPAICQPPLLKYSEEKHTRGGGF